jgi:hypothetical protein
MPKFWYIVPVHAFAGDCVVITGTDGIGFIVMIFIAISVPHPFVTEYMIVSVPAVTPETSMPEATGTNVAFGLLILHVPPVTLSVNVREDALHILEAPVIVPAFGKEPTVTIVVAASVPQLLITV